MAETTTAPAIEGGELVKRLRADCLAELGWPGDMKPEKLAPDNEVRQQIERDCRWQAAAFIEQSSTLLADAKRERDAALAEIVGLRNISKANIATMEGTVIRLNSYEKAHGELDLAIRETREVLSSPSPAFGVETGDRPCTCHPSEAPRPCPRMYALSDCQNAFGIALRLANGTLSWNACWEIAKAATAAVASFQFEPRSSGVERVIEAATIERCAKVAEARAASENAASARAYDAGRFGVSTCRDAGMEVAADIAKAIRALASLTGHGSYDVRPLSDAPRAQSKED